MADRNTQTLLYISVIRDQNRGMQLHTTVMSDCCPVKQGLQTFSSHILNFVDPETGYREIKLC